MEMGSQQTVELEVHKRYCNEAEQDFRVEEDEEGCPGFILPSVIYLGNLVDLQAFEAVCRHEPFPRLSLSNLYPFASSSTTSAATC